MALHQTGAKIGMACMLFLSFCGWVVSIGGTAHATNECRENTDEWKENDTVGESGHLQPFPGDSADEDRAYDCGVHFSLDWWIIAFQVGERARARGLQHTATPTPHSPGKSCTKLIRH
uniref:Uncharacterized protein n=1 Tax=Dunaliella tertiolecta TaxID=3047 RepID=A0A7S3R188_DUNTE